MTEFFKVGDVVRVVNPADFVDEKKLTDRDGIVKTVGPTLLNMFKGQVLVTFQKRNGRGKEFDKWMQFSWVEKKVAA